MKHIALPYNIPIIIPAYEPDDRLITLLKTLKKASISPIILINDGSGHAYQKIFELSKSLSDVILVHKKNRGKGAALKTGFRYVLNHYPKCIGVITVDSDGQHSVDCIIKIMKQMTKKTDTFILGVRNFDLKRIPWRSRLGNRMTRLLLYYLTGEKIRDTQTGLRGIPRSFLQNCLALSGNRFEFEAQMLLVAIEKRHLIEVPIKTIYDSVQNHQTHFNPLVDSIKIYKSLFYPFAKYIFSSLSSFILDICLFSVFLEYIFDKCDKSLDITLSTVFARTISVIYNYTMNYKVVFKTGASVRRSATRYLELALIQMVLSAFCTTGLNLLLPSTFVVGLKIFVDTILFMMSYFIQKKYVFSIKS